MLLPLPLTGPEPLPLPLAQGLEANFFSRVLQRSRMASKREPRSLSPRLVEGIPYLTGILLVETALLFLMGPEGVICGLGVDGLPFIMRFNH